MSLISSPLKGGSVACTSRESVGQSHRRVSSSDRFTHFHGGVHVGLLLSVEDVEGLERSHRNGGYFCGHGRALGATLSSMAA